MRELRQRFGEPLSGIEVDDTRVFLRSLAELTQAERRTALRVLTVAAILDGRLVRRERRLLLEAYEAAAIAPALEHVELLRRAFVSGDPILGPELLASAS
jgi:phage FluMu protein gp41